MQYRKFPQVLSAAAGLRGLAEVDRIIYMLVVFAAVAQAHGELVALHA